MNKSCTWILLEENCHNWMVTYEIYKTFHFETFYAYGTKHIGRQGIKVRWGYASPGLLLSVSLINDPTRILIYYHLRIFYINHVYNLCWTLKNISYSIKLWKFPHIITIYETWHEKIGLMCTKYTSLHYSTYLTFYKIYKLNKLYKIPHCLLYQ